MSAWRHRRHRLIFSLLLPTLAVFLLLHHLHTPQTPTSPTRIAYFIQVGPTNLHLLPRLILALYHPANYYAIHLDLKIPEQQGYTTLLTLFQTLSPHHATDPAGNLPNIIIMRSELVTYRGASMSMNYLTGINRLLAAGPWDFYINLSGSDYPTASQPLMHRLLSTTKHCNFVEWKPLSSWPGFAQKRLGEFYIDTALAKLHQPHSQYLDAHGNNVSKEGDPVQNPIWRHVDFVLAKTSGWFIFSRMFCEHLRGDADVRKLVALLSFSDASDEHLFASVLWNDDRWRSSVVGSNLRSIFFVAPNGSFAMGEDGVRSRQHPFWVDEVKGEGGEFLFWEELMNKPAFFTRKIRGVNSFRDRIDAQLLRAGSGAAEGGMTEYERRLSRRFEEIVAQSNILDDLPAQDVGY